MPNPTADDCNIRPQTGTEMHGYVGCCDANGDLFSWIDGVKTKDRCSIQGLSKCGRSKQLGTYACKGWRQIRTRQISCATLNPCPVDDVAQRAASWPADISTMQPGPKRNTCPLCARDELRTRP
ncbi:MAG: hypothetical protein ACI9MR_002556 [Myxococcota bacterium]|jgi:hypothetical protein